MFQVFGCHTAYNIMYCDYIDSRWRFYQYLVSTCSHILLVIKYKTRFVKIWIQNTKPITMGVRILSRISLLGEKRTWFPVKQKSSCTSVLPNKPLTNINYYKPLTNTTLLPTRSAPVIQCVFTERGHWGRVHTEQIAGGNWMLLKYCIWSSNMRSAIIFHPTWMYM